MDVLIFFMSMLQANSKETTYKAGDLIITGTQTNEAATKYLIKSLADRQERLDRVIAITTREAKDGALEVFRNGVAAFCTDKYFMPEITTVDSFGGDNAALPDRVVLENVMECITTEDMVYLDVTGGRRTEADKMLLLMKLVRYKGIRLADTVYSQITDYNKRTGEVCSHNEFYRYLDILDGVNQFVLTGNAAQLSACYDSAGKDSKVSRLLATMTEFSDSMTICNTAMLDKILENMRKNIRDVSDAPSCNMADFLFKQLIPVINDKFFGNGDTPDYCHIIRWCLENQLVQQAVTIYVEKMPKYILDKGLVAASDELRRQTEDNYKKPEDINIEKELFFSKLMSGSGVSANDDESNALIEKLKNALMFPSSFTVKDHRIDKAKKTILDFVDNYDSAVDYSKDEVKSALSAAFCGSVPHTREKKINQICSNKKTLCEVLKLPAPEKKGADTIGKKIYVIENIMDNPLADGFTLNIRREELKRIMIDYMYVRGVRNMINHASDNRETAEQAKALFEKNGINTTFGKDVIIDQMKKSVEYISGLAPCGKEEKEYALSH